MSDSPPLPPPLQPGTGSDFPNPPTDSRAQPARIWPALTAPILAVLVATTVVIITSIIGFAFIEFNTASEGESSAAVFEDVDQLMIDLAKSPWGIWLIALPGQLIFFLCALIPALCSPERTSSRLALRRGHLPSWTWIIIALGTPAIGIFSSMIIGLLGLEMSMSLKFIEALVSGRSGLSLASAFLLIAILPGICEEFLFRGYLQSRLLRRWHPAVAIGASSIIFAIAHLDPVHSLGVLPLGLWLGYVAYRSGSILPAILGHMTNNAFAVGFAQVQGAETLTFMNILPLIPTMLALIASIYLLRRKAV